MALQTTGVVTVDVDPGAAFAFVQDPQRMAQCIPGCHDLSELSSGRYSAILTNKVSFITLNFKVVVEVVKIEPPTTIDAKITGESVGVAGRLAATAGVRLADAGNGRTAITYVTDVGLTGKLGGLGQPVFKAKSVQLGAEFAANLKAAMEKDAAQRQASSASADVALGGVKAEVQA
jgi:carbon monoxide dehydrogenase subunit G